MLDSSLRTGKLLGLRFSSQRAEPSGLGPWAADRPAVAQGPRRAGVHVEQWDQFKGDAVNRDQEEFWSALPEKVLHPVRVPVIEALWWIGEPLSAIETVDVLDGFLSMWEAAHHLKALGALGVVKLIPTDQSNGKRNDSFAEQFRLTRNGEQL